MSSIFQAGGALPADHTTYVERRADHDALRAVLDGEYLHVIAPRQVGKTSLLKRLAARLGEMGWRCAYVDLSTLMDFPKPSWYTELGKVLAHSLTPGQTPTLSNQVDLRCYLLDQALPWLNSQPCIALFLDEVEGAGKARDTNGTSFSDTFFMTLRNLYIQRDNYEGTLVVALAGAVDPSDLVKDPDISPFNVGREIGLDDFTVSETRTLTGHLADLGLPVDEAVHQAIYNWASGHPYLTQRICTELEKAAPDGSLTALTPDHVDHVVKQVILNPVSPLQQDKNLRHVAKMLSRLSAPVAELWSRLRTGESISRREATDDLYLELYLTGVVKALAGRLVIRNRIYVLAFGEYEEVESKPLYEEYVDCILIAFYKTHQDPQSAGIRAHGFPGVGLAVEGGILSMDEFKAKEYWTSQKRWEIVAALRELIDRGYIKRTEDDTEDHVHPDQWNFRLTLQGKDYARRLLSESDEVGSVSKRKTGLTRTTRIFLSSTWEDLQPEREAVEKALQRMQDTAFAGMEYFGSRPETPKEVSLAEVDRSDVYIGIFAHHYGSGITEAEYRQAQERRIPCLVYFKDDNVPVKPAHIERDPRKITKLEALKQELKQDHTVSFFRSPDHLATQVVTDLHNLLGTAPSARKEEPCQPGPKYQITITDSQGVIIGDLPQVTQYFDADGQVRARTRRRIHIDVIVEGEVSDFTKERRHIVQDVLASVFRVERSEIRILTVQPGSIRLVIEVPEEVPDRLDVLSPSDISLLVSVGVQRIEGAGFKALDLRSDEYMASALGKPELSAHLFRLRHLADNIRQDLALLKDYEDALRYEDDPRRRARYRREIEQLRMSAAEYQGQYNELRAEVSGTPPQELQDVGTQLQMMDSKLDALLAGQAAIQDNLTDMRQAVLARFDASEQTIIAAVTEHLDQSQLTTVQSVLDAIEAELVPTGELQETLAAVQHVLAEIQQRQVTLFEPTLASEIEHLSEVIAAPKLDLKHKLKVTVPIIPLFLSYEGEVELGSGLNLETAWQRLAAKVRGE
jgi:hypothetical protein